MATAYKILGQVAPPEEQLVALYDVPPSRNAVGSTLVVCNRGLDEAQFRIVARRSAQPIEDKNYLVYDAPVAARDTLFLTIGVALASGELIEVYSSTGELSFSLFGSEIT